MDMLEILFRHQDFVAINKPGGISVHQDSGETGLARTLAIQLGVERVWLLHRLDKQTSGILLFALNKERDLCKIPQNPLNSHQDI